MRSGSARRAVAFGFAPLGGLVAVALAQTTVHRGVSWGLVVCAPAALVPAALALLPWLGRRAVPGGEIASSLLALVLLPGLWLDPYDTVPLYAYGVLGGWAVAGAGRFPRARVLGAGLGGALALVSLVGAGIPERPDPRGVYDVPTLHATERLAGLDDPRLAIRAGEPPLEYAVRLNAAVHRGLDFRDPDVTPRESWLIWIASRLPWADLVSIDHLAPDLILRHGGGLCGQQSLVFVEAARRNGLSATTLSLEGHIVALVRTAEGSYWFDPLFGIGGPRFPEPAEPVEGLLAELRSLYEARLAPHLPADDRGAWIDEILDTVASRDDDRVGAYVEFAHEAGPVHERLLREELLVGLAVLLASTALGARAFAARRS